ncbi:MAG: hypothetical protein DRP89_03475 [Candidatus Neomarinimicrobiota bacterium]|nr:MAG: hypothetical protein DRP89_03475 [Candidatus Neomarinimicrobiota bacterium]
MNSRRLLLINPWIADFAAFDLWAKPLGLLYIGKFLMKYGYEIELIDLLDRAKWGEKKNSNSSNGKGKYSKTIIPKPPLLSWVPRRYGLYGATKEQFLESLSNTEVPDAILVTSQMTYWYPGIKETVKVIREVYPEKPIILGGIYATFYIDHAKKVISPDYLIAGYGEKKTLILLDSLFEIERDYTYIPDFDDSGTLPWDLYSELYSVPIMTSRGCPFRCTYCATRLLHPHFFQRDPEDVIKEIVEDHDRFGVKNFAFFDDALFANRDRHIVPILEGVIDTRANVNFHTPNGLFAREIDKYLAELMKRAGFKTIRLSLESIVLEWQKASSGKVSRENFLTAVKNLEAAGFNRSDIEVYLIMGLPGQNCNQVKESLKFVAGTGTVSRLASFSPIPGTIEWERAKEMGYVYDDIDPLLTNNTLYPCRSRDFSVEEFIELRQLSNRLNEEVRQ